MAEEFQFGDYDRTKVPDGLEGRKYSRHHVKVAGASYRADDVEAFLRAAEHCQASGLKFGVMLRREPTNSHDPNAIAVDGFWESSGFLRSRENSVMLGYIPADLARTIKERSTRNSLMAALLKNGWIGDEGGVAIDIAVFVTMD
ncbi:MAG TPA: HIRAN domain-containing protein [Hyphomonadaceae bacterium]|jgi:hypothetical protein|nr:HIRAN domain-containing protein [Hyphomonadaceae bacterium]